MIKSSLLITVAVAALAIGCASDPNKDLKTAKNGEAEAIRGQDVDNAKADRKATTAEAQAATAGKEDGAKDLHPANEKVVSAQAGMDEARTVYRAKAVERMQKADARIKEAKAKVENTKSAPADIRSRIATTSAQRDQVNTEIEGLQKIGDHDWETAKKHLDQRLDELDKLVADVKERANKL